jgi:hypothetical protein
MTKTKCYGCDTDLLVRDYDLAERNYCTICAWNKVGEVMSVSPDKIYTPLEIVKS